MLAERNEIAVGVIRCHLGAIPHPDVGVLRLVQFSHASPGVEKMKEQIAEGIVGLLEDNGFVLCNGESGLISELESRGFVVSRGVDADVSD